MEWCTTDDGKYRIESLSPATVPGALRVIKDSFCIDENVVIGTEVNLNPVATEELLELTADAALDGVSVVAVETKTGEVVSACINKIQVLSDGTSTEKTFFEVFAEERCTQPSSRALVEYMIDVDTKCNMFEKYGVDCSLELMFLATLREHRRKGLAELLCRESIEAGKKFKDGPFAPITLKDLGPKYAHMQPRDPVTNIPKICQAIATSDATQKIGKALNFTVHYEASFREFVYKGKTYVDRIGSEVSYQAIARPIYF